MSECVEWEHARMPKGYGVVCVNGKRYYTHRRAYQICNGEIPRGLSVCHKCDNPPCFNPDHLFLGTQADNVRDMVKKGRRVKVSLPGQSNPKAKLSDSDVLQIRAASADGARPYALAAMFGVTYQTIWKIVKRRQWRHM